MIRLATWLFVLTFALTGALPSWAQERKRNAPQEFQPDYNPPQTADPAPAGEWRNVVDVAVLAAALGAAAWLAHRKRTRRGMIALTIFAVAYFGFWRQGCVCSVGSFQNVAYSLFHGDYRLPLTVGLIFLLPLVFALFWGRVFCAGVCPLGAMQDLVLVKPVKTPGWVDQSLGVLPYIYLGLGVLLAATGTKFVVCQYDPFVPIYRLDGPWFMLALGVTLLATGLFIGRPYCRFLCPYGALLSLASRFSKWTVRVYPDKCISCRLCEQSCPVNAIRLPEERPAMSEVAAGKRRLLAMLALLPLLTVAGGCLGGQLAPRLANLNSIVIQARLVWADEQATLTGQPTADKPREVEGHIRSRASSLDLYRRAAQVERSFTIGSWALGLFAGLVIGLKLVGLARARTHADYMADRAACVACARCFEHCPNELEHRKQASPATLTPDAAGQTAPAAATTLTIKGQTPSNP